MAEGMNGAFGLMAMSPMEDFLKQEKTGKREQEYAEQSVWFQSFGRFRQKMQKCSAHERPGRKRDQKDDYFIEEFFLEKDK